MRFDRLALALLLFVPAVVFASEAGGNFWSQQGDKIREHRAKMDKEREEFLASLDGKSPQEWIAAMRDYKIKRFNEEKDFQEPIARERREFFQKRLENDTQLTDEQRAANLAEFDSRGKEALAFEEKQHQEDIAFLDQLAKGTYKSVEDVEFALREHAAGQERARQAFYSALNAKDTKPQ